MDTFTNATVPLTTLIVVNGKMATWCAPTVQVYPKQTGTTGAPNFCMDISTNISQTRNYKSSSTYKLMAAVA